MAKATTAIFMTWGMPIPGRERAALEEFSSFVQWAAKLKTEGRIERFETYAPIYGAYQVFAGFILVEGSEPQIDALSKDQEFLARIDRVLIVAQNPRVEVCYVGDGVANRMKLYGSTLQQLKL